MFDVRQTYLLPLQEIVHPVPRFTQALNPRPMLVEFRTMQSKLHFNRCQEPDRSAKRTAYCAAYRAKCN